MCTRLQLTSTRACRIFTLLEWRLGTLLLGGTASLSSMPPFVQPFTQLSPPARDSFLQGWATSSIPQILQVCPLPMRAHERFLL